MIGPYRIRRPDVGETTVAHGPEAHFDFYLDRLLKMIPAEVVGLYLVGDGIIPREKSAVRLGWVAVCLVGVFFLRVYATTDRVRGEPPDLKGVAVATVTFLIWVYSLGGPFDSVGIYIPYLGSLLVLAWTFFIPIVYRGPEL
jgi:hypothetical protein